MFKCAYPDIQDLGAMEIPQHQARHLYLGAMPRTVNSSLISWKFESSRSVCTIYKMGFAEIGVGGRLRGSRGQEGLVG